MDTVQSLNTWLWGKEGTNPQGGPRYRLTLSHTAMEWRRGTFNEFYGDLFLRTVSGERLVKKYPFIKKDRWILEKWFPPEITFSLEIPESRNGVYEPIYVFEDEHGNALEVTYKVLEVILHFAETGRLRPAEASALDKAEQEKQERMQAAIDEDSLEISTITNALHLRQAVTKL